VNNAEARERVAAQDAKLRELEAEISRLASVNATPVLLAMLRALVEMVCQSQGPSFAVLKKIKLYEGVLLLLREKGIS
jgi:hypothetical protein